MKCPNCGLPFSEGFLCPACGVDAFVFRRTRQTSIRLYNQALEMALEDDLSGAAEHLEQSLLFDKKNIQARNLLGLIYCETGHIGDALKHWIISTSMQPCDNLAGAYMEYLQRHARDMDKCNDAVRLYNQAIAYLRQGSEDLAIIQLKKAIDNNPNFLDAYNLMTLCCMEDKNQKRAIHFNNIVLKRDIRNPIAMHYARILGNLSPSAGSAKQKKAAKNNITLKRTDSPPPLPSYKRTEKKNGVLDKRDFLAFLAGIAAAAIVIFVLIVPALNETKDAQMAELQKQVESYAGKTNMTPEEVLTMGTELEQLKEENKQLRSEENKQANLELLQTAVAQMTDGDFETCVTTLSAIDTAGFSEEDIAKYDSVKATAYPKAADSYYTKGKSAFLSNSFTEAKADLETALLYVNQENFVDDIYYYLAKIAEKDGDTIKAKDYYNKILKDYPDSNQSTNVKNALSQLDGTAAD